MNYSRQRELIQLTVQQTQSHPTADTVYAMVREQEPAISLGTVYRNLNLLAKHGILRKLVLPGIPDHFDGRLDEHDHLHCESCGGLFDIDLGELEELSERIRQIRGFTVTGYQVYVSGVCRDCSGKQ